MILALRGNCGRPGRYMIAVQQIFRRERGGKLPRGRKQQNKEEAISNKVKDVRLDKYVSNMYENITRELWDPGRARRLSF